MNARILSAAAALTVLLACDVPVHAGPVLPNFSPSNFVAGAPIDNPYFPLVPGTLFRTRGIATDPETGEQSVEVDEDFVTSQTAQIAGVTARVVRSRVFADGLLVEDTLDHYAQDVSGNVWYLGEDTTAFERDDSGAIISTDTTGSWTAGVNGGLPGFVMPVDYTVGFNYRQEFAPDDEAVDQATILATDLTIDVPAGHFTHVLKTRDFTDLEPGVAENKYYAPGVGLILTEDLDEAGGVAGSFALQSVSTAAVPLPPAVGSGIVLLLSIPALRWCCPRARISGWGRRSISATR